MIFIILALTQTTCAFGNNTTFAQIPKSYAADDNSTVDTETLLELITILAETMDEVIDDIISGLNETLVYINDTVDLVNDNFDAVKGWFIIVAISVGALFLITWMMICCCIGQEHYALVKQMRNNPETIPLRTFPQ